MTGRFGSGGHTIGVAISIPSPHREVLEEARLRFDPALGDQPAHLTILAPIDVDADAMPAVMEHLAGVAVRTLPFRLTLHGAGTFRPVSPVVFVTVAEGIASCEELERSVRSGDMEVDSRFPYHPHVTLAHDVSDEILDQAFAELEGFRASFRVESLGLYEYLGGAWCLIREFDFGG